VQLIFLSLIQIYKKIFVEFYNIIFILNYQINVFQTSAYLTAAFKQVFKTQCSLKLVLKKKDLKRKKYLKVAQESCLH